MGIQSINSSPSVSMQYGAARSISAAPENNKIMRAEKLPARENNQTGLESQSEEVLRDTAERVGKAVSVLNEALTYEIDETTEALITRIINRHTQEIIRQIPPEEVMEISRRLHEYVGLIFNNET